MKKSYLVIMLLMFSVLLFACGEKSYQIVISKVYDATTQVNNAIELYNTSDKTVNLNNYALNFYTNGSLDVSQTIALSGSIDAKSYYVIASSEATDSELIDATDLIYQEGTMPFNGNDVIELVHKNNVVDTVGQKGINIEYAKDLTLIRLGEVHAFQAQAEFYAFNFIYYLPDLFQFLKNDNYEIKTIEDIYNGPRLEDRYLEMPYVSPDNDTIGGGGAVLTINTGIADGDTAYFRAGNGFPGGSVRYYYLNTPEVQGSYVNAEPWGYVASKYNKEYQLVNANEKTIYVQSMAGYALTEVNGRNLALVWINGYLSQFMIVSEGLSEEVDITYDNYDRAMSYKYVPYLTFLRFVEERAKINGWATKGYPSNPDGEKSPDWNYAASGGGSNTTVNPVWSPHLTLPWE